MTDRGGIDHSHPTLHILQIGQTRGAGRCAVRRTLILSPSHALACSRHPTRAGSLTLTTTGRPGARVAQWQATPCTQHTPGPSATTLPRSAPHVPDPTLPGQRHRAHGPSRQGQGAPRAPTHPLPIESQSVRYPCLIENHSRLSLSMPDIDAGHEPHPKSKIQISTYADHPHPNPPPDPRGRARNVQAEQSSPDDRPPSPRWGRASLRGGPFFLPFLQRCNRSSRSTPVVNHLPRTPPPNHKRQKRAPLKPHAAATLFSLSFFSSSIVPGLPLPAVSSPQAIPGKHPPQ